MPLTLIKEDGTGNPDANTYALMCEAHFRCAVAGASGSGNVRIWAMFADSSTGVPVFYRASDDIALDTTVSIAFDVTGQFASAGQSIRVEQGMLEVVR